MASTEQQIDDAVAKRHSQHTDTALGVQSSDLDMNLHKIIGLEDPTGDKDAAHKKYVDDHAGGGGSGDVVGPSSAIANAIPLFDGITGKLIKDSTRLIEDVMTDDKHLPDGHAIKVYGDAHWTAGSGDVVGPDHAINEAIALFDTITGKLIKDSTRLIEDIMTDGKHIPDGHAIKEYGDANWGGYTNLTQFVAQTAWRLFYSNDMGDVIELAFGADGTYLKSNGAVAAPTFVVPGGAGDVVGPGTHAADYVPQWNATPNSKILVQGFAITAAGKALMDDANASIQRDTLGLGSVATRTVRDTLMVDDETVPDGNAIIAYGAANWGGGYTNLTSFVNQTAWRVFYSNNLGDVVELGFGVDGQYLKSNGPASALTWGIPGGSSKWTDSGDHIYPNSLSRLQIYDDRDDADLLIDKTISGSGVNGYKTAQFNLINSGSGGWCFPLFLYCEHGSNAGLGCGSLYGKTHVPSGGSGTGWCCGIHGEIQYRQKNCTAIAGNFEMWNQESHTSTVFGICSLIRGTHGGQAGLRVTRNDSQSWKYGVEFTQGSCGTAHINSTGEDLYLSANDGNSYIFAKAYSIKMQAAAPGLWLDETGNKGAFLVLDGGDLQVQRRATGFGNFEATPFQVNLATGNGTFVGTVTASCGTLTCDYVFEDNYGLLPLNCLAKYVKREKKLPGMTINEGGVIDTATMREQIVEKLEEQILYVLQLHDRIKTLEAK